MRIRYQRAFLRLAVAAVAGVAFGTPASAQDHVMWGGTPSRNMVSEGKNPPTEWDVKTGQNIKWTARLGSQSYGSPIVANGIVFVGTNNEARYDPSYTKDAGVFLALDEKTGKFIWQNLSPKLAAGRVNDWPFQGICASPEVEKNLLWYCTSRCEILAFDLSPMQSGEKPRQVWKLDMMDELGVFPHNMTSSSIVSHGDLIFVITGNGVDETHKNIPSPDAPAIIAINKTTGKVAWQQNPVGQNILHGQWASPAVTQVNGKAQVIAPLGDGWIYSFDAMSGNLVWKFDSNNKDTIYPRTRNELIATPVIVDNRLYIANGQDPEHGEGVGHLWCIDVTKTGDISREIDAGEGEKNAEGDELLRPSGGARKGKPNPNSGVIWDFEKHDANKDGKIKGSERMNRTISTVSVYQGLVFAPDFSGFLHCLDARTGQHHWTYDMEAAMWGSPLAVDGKVYLADEDGDVAIFEAKKDAKEPIAEHNVGNAIYGSPVFANDTLYIMAKDRLIAIANGAKSAPVKGE
jgi:outer membrane protein assembly factor BamB